MKDYTNTEDFQRNLENQFNYFEESLCRYQSQSLFNDWDGFLFHYNNIRAGLSSLLRNPDTKSDPDFLELCETWRNQRFGCTDTQHLVECYNRLSIKPVFKENPIFRDLYGSYVKSIYQLFHENYYAQDFFRLE